jgi:hypothetical protein
MMAGILDLFNVLYDPNPVFARVKEKPRFWAPFLTLAVIQVVTSVLMMPFTRQLMQNMAQAQGAAGQSPPAWAAWIGVIIAPIGLAIGLLIGAGILWMLVSVLAGEGSFRHLLSVATYAGVTTILLTVASVVVLMIGGGRVETAADLRPGFGLDLLVPEATGFVKTLLWTVNPFTLWGMVLTGLGIAGTHNATKGTAFTIAGIAFVINAIIGAALAGLGG